MYMNLQYFGGRGASSGMVKDTVMYEPKTRGQITRYEAGILYKAVKNGDVKALPETTSMMYDESNYQIKFASSRYSQDWWFYDRVSSITKALLNGRNKDAQKDIDYIEKQLIERAGKKSRFFKYKK